MSDLIGIGVSGLSAYQRALATTSNNIANLQTEGYVRQRAVLASSGQDPNATISVGTGVRFAEVQRLYDRFAEENLQRASSTLEAEESMLKELQALQDAIGSSEAGLHGAFQDFFDGARELEAAPSSAGARAGFLAKAEGLAARFRGLAETAANLDGDSRAQIDQALAETNTLLSEIASLNKQLLKRNSESEQPMQLLDQRDAAIRELSKKIGVTVVLGPSGAASIYAGESASGAALVEGGSTRAISAAFDEYDFGRSEFVLDAASQPVVIPSIKTGLIGGLLGFRREGLGLTINKLDELALAFGRTVNKLHRDGLDYSGRPGQDLFYIGPKFRIDGRANGGGARLGVTVLDSENVRSTSYEMRFRASAGLWEVTETGTGRSVTGLNNLELDGLRFSIEGAPRDGDTFRITPENHPAATFATLIKDGSQVASAGMFAVRASASNSGATSADMTVGSPRDAAEVRSITDILPSPKLPVGESTFIAGSEVRYQDTSVAARTGPIAVIPAGYSKVALNTALGEGSELAIFTRDGRQITGPKMDSSIVSENYGFYAGAAYSDTYLNRVGSSAYLDREFSQGLFAQSGSQQDGINGLTLTPAKIFGETVTTKSITAQSLLVNGITVPIEAANKATTAATLNSVAGNINLYRALTGVSASVAGDRLTLSSHNDVRFDLSEIDVTGEDRVSMNLNGGQYTVGFRVRVNKSDFETGQNYLNINGKKLTFSTLAELDTAIDTVTGLTASITGNELLIKVSSNDTTITVGSNSIGLEERSDLYLKDDGSITSKTAADKLVELINDANPASRGVNGVSTPILTGLIAKSGVEVSGLSLTIGATSTAGVYDISRAAGTFTEFEAGDTVTISAGGVAAENLNKSLLVLSVSSDGKTLRCQPLDGSSLTEESGKLSCVIERFVQVTQREVSAGQPIVVGANTVGLEEKTYFNDDDIRLDIVADGDKTTDERAAFASLGFRSGFVMREAIAEDLLVFGVDKNGSAQKLSLSGTYTVGSPPDELKPESRTYSLEFIDGNYRLIDSLTATEVSAGKFDSASRTVRYGSWAVTLGSVPTTGDKFTILKNDDAAGDNRIASLIANLQFDRTMLASKQTVQQDYEDLVNKVGVLTVQAEIGRDAQQVVFTQAQENRDRISGVNLDEELSDLLRFQQAYQANAQVIQTASRLFDSLMQRL